MVKKKKYPEIPDGLYCYTYIDEHRYVCPYHKYRKGYGTQEDGYCEFLKKGDYELNRELEYVEEKTGDRKTANELGLPLSLLWDMCKMCYENLDYEDEEEKPNFIDKIGIGKEDPFLDEEK